MIVLFTANVIGATIFSIPDFLTLFRQYRLSWQLVKPAKTGSGRYTPTPQDFQDCIQMSLRNYFLAIVPLCFVGWPFLAARGLSGQGDIPFASSVVVQLIFFMLMEDMLGYWIHRWMHQPWAYKHIHHVHHKYTHPFALANLYMSPYELMNMGMAVVVGPMLIGAHLFVYWIWLYYRVLDSYFQHAGYDWPWDPRKLIASQPAFHDAHHHYRNANFSFNFSIMDRLFGTWKDPCYHPDE